MVGPPTALQDLQGRLSFLSRQRDMLQIALNQAISSGQRTRIAVALRSITNQIADIEHQIRSINANQKKQEIMSKLTARPSRPLGKLAKVEENIKETQKNEQQRQKRLENESFLQRVKSRKGFFSKVGGLGAGFRKKSKETKEAISGRKEQVVSGAKFAYQRPLRRLSQISWWIKPLIVVIIILLVFTIFVGFNISQFGWLRTGGGLIFLIGGAILIFFGFSELSKTHNIGYLLILGGLIGLYIGALIYGLFSLTYLYITGAFLIIYFVLKSKLSPKIKFFIILGLVLLALIFYFFSNLLALVNIELLKWVLFVVLSLLGFWLIFKKDQQGKYSYRFIGLILIIISALSLFLSTILSVIGFDFTTIFSSFRWLIIGFLGVMLLVSLLKGKFTWAIFFFFLIFVVWFLGSESGVSFLESLGMKAQVAGGETFSVRLSKYWGYIKNPEAFFARYGEFGNPNVENRALVGLKIEKFEPLIKEFRTNQDLRFSGEVKHYSLPVFKQGESGAKESSELNIGFSCYIPKNMQGVQSNLTPYFADKIEVKPGKTEEVTNNGYKEAILKESFKFKNFTKFVFCTFNHGNVGTIKEKETRQVYLNVSYKDFVTRSDIYAYLLGDDVYKKTEDGVLQTGGDLDTEFLYQLRSAASYPGLIDNERRTVSEFSSGPVWLQVNILDQQPLKSKGSEQYTLRIKSMPNSVDWIGSINVKNIYLVVPSWFNPVSGACDFSDGANAIPGTIEDDVRSRITYASSVGSTGVKRLLLNKQILDDTKTGCAGGKQGDTTWGSGCSFLCSFTVNSDGNEQNIQEYRISAYQTTDYSISQGTTFDLIRSRTTGVIDENEKARQNPHGFMDELANSERKENLERYLSICNNKGDSKLSDETINSYILKDSNNCNKVSEVQEKLNKLSGQLVTSGTEFSILKAEAKTQRIENDNNNFAIQLSVETNKPAICKYTLTEGSSTQELNSDDNKINHNLNISQFLPFDTGYNHLNIICNTLDNQAIVQKEVPFTKPL